MSAGWCPDLPNLDPAELVRGEVFFWASLMADALLASIPVVTVYAFFTEHFVSRLTAGATKY